MSDDPLYKCWCKATAREEGKPRYSKNWVTSKRAWFKIYGNRIECGSWVIPFTDVTQAVIYNTSHMFIPVQVLQLITEKGNFQFGFNPWASPFKYLSLNVAQENVRLKHSPFIIAIRILVVGYLAYWIWDMWVKT